MRSLQADPGTVESLADRCRGWSADLAPTPVPRSFTTAAETGAAIRAVDEAAYAVAEELARRMQQTAAVLDTAAQGYRSGESESAAALA